MSRRGPLVAPARSGLTIHAEGPLTPRARQLQRMLSGWTGTDPATLWLDPPSPNLPSGPAMETIQFQNRNSNAPPFRMPA